ncbi:MAG: hypothetical protein IT383_16200 [Deltaproteobacteria bacterium]|nr:hypothetical protein [Deltaproteobacteria bacterium]
MTQLQAFLLTLTIEVPVAVFLGRRLGLVDLRRLALVAVAATTLTHPFAFWAAESWHAWSWASRAAVIEIAVAAAESAVYRLATRASLKQAVVLGVATNALSFFAGLALGGVLWWVARG